MYRTTENSATEAHRGQAWITSRRFNLLRLVLFVSVVLQSAYAQSTANEYQVKAAVLFHFLQLVQWPSGATNASNQSIIFCVFDDEPHRLDLESTLNGKVIGARVVQVRLINQPANLQGCNVVFLSRDESRRQTVTLNSQRGLPVLTVGETDEFYADGGMIRLRIEEDKIRFDINLAAAESSHLQISSRLLLLATTVTRPGTSDGRRVNP
jgi:YfiR/HmsC-like